MCALSHHQPHYTLGQQATGSQRKTLWQSHFEVQRPCRSPTRLSITADQAAAVAKAVEEAGEVPEDATAALVITGLKRPFTANTLEQLLSQTGHVKGAISTKHMSERFGICKKLTLETVWNM